MNPVDKRARVIADWVFSFGAVIGFFGVTLNAFDATPPSPWLQIGAALAFALGWSGKVYLRTMEKVDLADELRDGVRRLMHDANGPYRYAVEKELRQREVWHVYFDKDEVVVTTHAVGDWHAHGHGTSLQMALMDLDQEMERSPRPPGRITTGEVRT